MYVQRISPTSSKQAHEVLIPNLAENRVTCQDFGHQFINALALNPVLTTRGT